VIGFDANEFLFYLLSALKFNVIKISSTWRTPVFSRAEMAACVVSVVIRLCQYQVNCNFVCINSLFDSSLFDAPLQILASLPRVDG
jgi:hypothetical protein